MVAQSVVSGGNGDRKDGLAWKPDGLHRSRWSRRPWDFHAIALRAACAAPENGEQKTERAGAKRQIFHGYGKRNAPAG